MAAIEGAEEGVAGGAGGGSWLGCQGEERRGDGLLVESFWGMHGLESPGRGGRATMVGEYISLLLEVSCC